MKAYLSCSGLDIRHAEIFFDMLASSSSEEEEVSIDAFVDGCMKMKGEATSLDMQVLLYKTKVIYRELRRMHHLIKGAHAQEATPPSSGAHAQEATPPPSGPCTKPR